MMEKTKKVWSMDKTLVGMEESAGAVIRRCSVNKVFWKVSQNYTCAGVFLMKFQALKIAASLNGCFWISYVFGVYILFWSPLRGGERVWKSFEDNAWMFWLVIWTICEGRYYKINYKYERRKLVKLATKNISCSFICSFIFLIFSYVVI